MITTPKVYTNLQSIFAGIFFLVCMPLAFFGFQKTQNIELRPALDILFLLTLVISIVKTDRSSVRKVQIHLAVSFSLSIFYITNTVARAGLEFHTIPTLKVFFYIIFLLMIFISKSFISKLNLKRIVNLFLLLATIKYAVSIITGLNYRPIFWTENNFEVLFFIIVFLHEYHHNIKGWQKYISGFLVLMSGSASGALSMIAAITVLQVKKRVVTFIGISIVCGVLTFTILLPKFSNGIEVIDRYAYLISGMATLLERSYLEILFGPGFAKPLSIDSCMQLSYIKAKVTAGYICYSNTLSIGLLRYVIDFGIIGTGYIIYLVFRLLRLSGYTSVFSASVLTAILLNGISVSGFSNQFAIFALLILLSKNKNEMLTRQHA